MGAHLASSFSMVRRKAWFSASEAAFTNWHLKTLRACAQTQLHDACITPSCGTLTGALWSMASTQGEYGLTSSVLGITVTSSIASMVRTPFLAQAQPDALTPPACTCLQKTGGATRCEASPGERLHPCLHAGAWVTRSSRHRGCATARDA